MLAVSLAVWLAGPASDCPMERLVRFLEGASSLRVSGSFRSGGLEAALEHRRERGVFEGTVVTLPAGTLEMRSTRAGTLVLDHAQRVYGRYAFEAVESAPPLDVDPRLVMARPTFLLPGSFRTDPPGGRWKRIETPPALAGGVETLRWFPSSEDRGGDGDPPASDVRVGVDRVGAPRWVRTEEATPDGSVVREWSFDRIEVGGASGDPADLSPPWGFTPYRLPAYRRPARPGTGAPDASFHLRTRTSLREATRLRPVVLLFTAQGCAPSADGAPTWERIGRLARALGARVVHVALDEAPPIDGWESATDPSGELESALGLPMTPYAFAFKPGGRLVATWAGYGAGEGDKIVKALLGPLGE